MVPGISSCSNAVFEHLSRFQSQLVNGFFTHDLTGFEFTCFFEEHFGFGFCHISLTLHYSGFL